MCKKALDLRFSDKGMNLSDYTYMFFLMCVVHETIYMNSTCLVLVITLLLLSKFSCFLLLGSQANFRIA